MNLVADENIPASVVTRLRADGHAIQWIRETDIGAVDPAVLAASVQVGAVLLTQDKDFGELVYRQAEAHRGVILIRLAGMSSTGKAEHLSTTIRQHENEFPGAFTVISPAGVRIRRPDPPVT